MNYSEEELELLKNPKLTNAEISRMIGRSRQTISSKRGRMGLSRRKVKSQKDPTPKQIKQRCKKIQEEWSPQQEYSRRVIKNPQFELLLVKRVA